jgi:Spy/CpxP family protein refolding chaperone
MVNRPVPEEWAPRHLKRLADRLELTPQQEDLIRPIVRRNMEQLNHVRSQSMAETQLIVEDMQREISERLTPEQRTKFEQMNREAREAREARDKAEKAKRANADHPPGEQPPPAKPPGN